MLARRMLLGVLLGLGASASWALANVAVQRAARAVGAFRAMVWAQLLGAALVAPLSLAFDRRSAPFAVAADLPRAGPTGAARRRRHGHRGRPGGFALRPAAHRGAGRGGGGWAAHAGLASGVGGRRRGIRAAHPGNGAPRAVAGAARRG